jgi:hypothetical protein
MAVVMAFMIWAAICPSSAGAWLAALTVLTAIHPVVGFAIARWSAIVLAVLLPVLAVFVHAGGRSRSDSNVVRDVRDRLARGIGPDHGRRERREGVGTPAIAGGRMTRRLRPRDLPVLIVVGVLSAAVLWTTLADLEVLRVQRQWAPQWIVLLTVLVLPLVAIWDAAPHRQASWLWAFVAPLVGAFLVAHFYAFDVYGEPPYSRNADAGDMPGWAIFGGASVAVATGIITWFHRRAGIALTVAVSLGCAILVFFSNVFH